VIILTVTRDQRSDSRSNSTYRYELCSIVVNQILRPARSCFFVTELGIERPPEQSKTTSFAVPVHHKIRKLLLHSYRHGVSISQARSVLAAK
jgi:hypothetical protein